MNLEKLEKHNLGTQEEEAMKSRRIHINDEVNEETMFTTMYYMDKIKAQDEVRAIPMKDRQPITLVVNSYGGSVYEALALIGKIENFQKLGYKIDTLVTGKAMSCGSLISVCGSTRRAYKYSTILIHKLSGFMAGQYDNLVVTHEENIRIQNLLENIYIAKCKGKLSKELLLEKTKGIDWYITPEDALELGIIDEII